MRDVICFVSGVAVGAVGALLYLQRDYKKRVEKLETEHLEDVNKDSEGSENGENSRENRKKTDENEAKSDSSEDGSRDPEAPIRVLMGATDRFGYTDYSGNEALSHKKLSDLVAENREITCENGSETQKNEENSDKNGSESGADPPKNRNFEDEKYENNGQNLKNLRVNCEKNEDFDEKSEEIYAPLLKMKSDACARKSDALDDFEDEEDENEDDFDENEPVFEPPYPISEEDFLHGYRNFTKNECKYFVKNREFVDENDECVTFLAQCVTFDFEKWRMEIEDEMPEVVYARNEKLGSDFKIYIVDDSCWGE